MSAHLHTATRGSFHRVNLTMSSLRCRPSMAPYYPGDRVQAHRVASRLTATTAHLRSAFQPRGILSLPLTPRSLASGPPHTL